MNRSRLRAEHSAKDFYNRRQNLPVEALIGDGTGNVDVTGRLNWVWVRIRGDSYRVAVAYNASARLFAEDDSVNLLWTKRTGIGYYAITGYSGAVSYDIYGSGSGDETGTGVKAHAWQHERRDLGEGGSDPLDIYARMVMPLRARPQTVPNMTLYVEDGPNPLTGKWFAGGSSAAFTVPGGPASSRYDLLYLGNDDALHILLGTAVVGPSATRPDMPLGTVPLAYVYLTPSTTTITEAIIKDARLIVGFVDVTGGLLVEPLLDDDGEILSDDSAAPLFDG